MQFRPREEGPNSRRLCKFGRLGSAKHVYWQPLKEHELPRFTSTTQVNSLGHFPHVPAIAEKKVYYVFF